MFGNYLCEASPEIFPGIFPGVARRNGRSDSCRKFNVALHGYDTGIGAENVADLGLGAGLEVFCSIAYLQ